MPRKTRRDQLKKAGARKRKEREGEEEDGIDPSSQPGPSTSSQLVDMDALTHRSKRTTNREQESRGEDNGMY